jgi:hypothetical protein
MVMIVPMPVFMPVVVSVPLAERLLRQGVVLGEGFVVAVLVPAAIGTRLGLEGRLQRHHAQSQAQQQLAQYGVVFQLQIVLADFHRRMAVAKVVGGAQQHVRVRAGGAQHRLGRRDHAHQAAVVRHEGVAVAQDGPARQEQGDLVAVVQRRGQPAAAA